MLNVISLFKVVSYSATWGPTDPVYVAVMSPNTAAMIQ